MSELNALKRLLAPIQRKLQMMVGRAVLTAAADDSTKLQNLQLTFLADETKNKIERFQQYGFTSVPLPGAEAVTLFVGGNREHPICTNVDDRRYRPKGLEAGEVALYTDQGDKIHIKRDGTLEIIQATKVNIVTPDVEITCENNVKITCTDAEVTGSGNLTATLDGDATVTATNAKVVGTTKATVDAPAIELVESATEALIKGNVFQTLFNAHTHNGNLGAPTGPPITPLSGTELSTIVKTG